MTLDVYRGRKTPMQQQQPTWPRMFTVDVNQQNNTKKKQQLFGEDVVVEEVWCVAWWKGAAVTFGNSALFKDLYVVYD